MYYLVLTGRTTPRFAKSLSRPKIRLLIEPADYSPEARRSLVCLRMTTAPSPTTRKWRNVASDNDGQRRIREAAKGNRGAGRKRGCG